MVSPGQADEVRNLAQRSTEAARETADQIADSLRKSEHAAVFSEKISHNLLGMLVDIRQMDTRVGQIASACQEQSRGFEQLKASVESIDGVTQQNAAEAQKSASTAEALAGQTHELARTVREMRRLINGRRKSAAPAVSSSAVELPEQTPGLTDAPALHSEAGLAV